MKLFFRRLAAAVLTVTMLVTTASALSVEQALTLLEQDYLRPIPAEAYEAEDLDELFEILGDRYTLYLTEGEYRSFVESVENTVSLVGIGVSISYTPQGILVLETIPGGGAKLAGMREGDLIVAVDGVPCAPADESHRELIMGEAGSSVALTVLRNGVPMLFVVTRSAVTISNTTATLEEGNVAVIECGSFGLEAETLFRQAVETYGEEAVRWVIDLRGNTGGYANAAVDALGVLAGPGYYLYLRDRAGWIYYYECTGEQVIQTPAVILVDGGTASAAEGFAAGVRDMGIGIVVGSRTYGKGTAQIVLDETTHPELFEGDALKLTAYRFYSTGGVTNDRVGMLPTLLVDDDYAAQVALALCADMSGENWENLLMLQIRGLLWAVDLTAAAPDTLSALFDALPPGAEVWFFENGAAVETTVTLAAERLGIGTSSRWFSDVAESPYAEEINTLATYDLLRGDEAGNFNPADTMTRGEACAMLAVALGLPGSDRQYFSDVPADHPCAPWINALAEMGFVAGTGNGRFDPDRPMTRQEYCAVLGRIAVYLDLDAEIALQHLNRETLDFFAGQGFAPWACAEAALMEMLDGLYDAEGAARPDDPLLREEAAAALCAILRGTGILSL